MTPRTSRLPYFLSLIITIILGLLSRIISALPLWIGDSLWAVAVYLGFRLFFTSKKPEATALIATLVSFVVECSQMIRWAPLDKLRATTIGHLLLGQGFLLSDLAAYLLGISLIYTLDILVCQRNTADF